MESFQLTSSQLSILIKKYYKDKKGKKVVVKPDITGGEPLLGEKPIPASVDFHIKEEGAIESYAMPKRVLIEILDELCDKAGFEPQNLDFTYQNGDYTATITGNKKTYGKHI